ncbi:Hsp33 family molecular chaperone HslO [Solemya velesiana gill symbiont]|uniref:Molecular chaperone Hsp33 n=1 Tax=Solemya velesiana gill symbiont TaxID=1918948 RepID=A0A1T2KYF5_9GAMM|nr:Hsp33 family molecular chaperone HslO [Solemya velesiana gill symbiont]OOZ37897.1 molecular chaperone Hsp33 [Solemya velesiana gill symbiont]
MSNHDQLHRFVFEGLDVRGELVQMDASWKAILERYAYPDNVRNQLGQAMAASLLLSAIIKFEGSLILQAQCEGPLTTLVAQATHQRMVRGLARWESDVPDGTLSEIYGPGRMVLTIDNVGKERYQGIVGMEGDTLAHTLEAYFEKPEQLDTRIWLAADGERAAGLFIQELPSEKKHEEDWRRVAMLADTVTPEELLRLEAEELLHRLFNEEDIQLFDPEPAAFRCGCSKTRIADALRSMGYADVKEILHEHGKIQADCEFCNKQYLFDKVDVEQIFAQDVKIDSPKTTH